ncbi:MAG: hypothetical protein U0934_15775 [Pseudotabrizicola sp.]|uniref:hypothetical protein n=1 Tax=Pseudotabrizicola sp. TaxID=2939647 RepID=UPI00272FE598|nr:hypothetical protein [Pseudotabrizicola sp.]MDP2079942.1 hypothetical protein [Pseudotabrizicola sp.]MDZ7575386.1 hypothetical protein [Pseudotabrizicola sp.]
MIRPEAQAALWRWREVGLGGLVLMLGLWLIRLGGYLLVPLGVGISLAGVALAVLAWRRLRFATPGDAPGVVQVDEGQVAYMGPQVGGFVSLRDLIELRLIGMRGRRLWRLKQADGQTLLIPVEAAGSEALFDAFSALPGMSSADLVTALEPPAGADSRAVIAGGENRLVWRRRGHGSVMATE